MNKKTRIFSVILVGLILFALGGVYVSQTIIRVKAASLMSSFGFQNPEIGNLDYFGNGVAINEIKLDPDAFSTIKNIRTAYTTLLGSSGGDVIIDKLSLSGTLNFPGGLDVSGWRKPQTQWEFPDYNLILNDARMDLMTPNGAIRLQAKGLTQKQADGSLNVNGALWGVQHQLNLDTRWNGKVTTDGAQDFNIEVLKGTVHLDYLSVSRLSGQANMKWQPDAAAPEVKGQLAIGKLDIAGIPLNSAKLEFSGPLGQQTIVLQAYIPGKNIMQAGIRLEQGEKDTQVEAAINAHHLDDLLDFLTALRTNINQSTWGIGIFMPLMLTQGNMDRIKNDMKGIEYDELQLSVTGSLHDMTGKIIAYRKDGHSGAKHIISLDPGFSE